MEQTNKKNTFDKAKAYFALMGLVGFLWAYGGASTMDYNDAATAENTKLGYTKNVIINPNPIKDVVGGTLLMGTAVLGFKIRNKHEKSR